MTFIGTEPETASCPDGFRPSPVDQFADHRCSRVPTWQAIVRCWLPLALVVALGAALRLVWIDDIEYKTDEAWTYHHAHAAGRTEPLSWVGMPSSAGPENPGMSLWAFVPLASVTDSPTGLARAVAWLSVGSILLLIAFAVWCVAPPEREAWLWAAALLSVNPLAVLHHRKIWPPCLLPVLVVLFLICWWHRRRRVAAFGWGALGSAIGQIHLGAFFFTAGFVLWSWLWQRPPRGTVRPANAQVAWKSWLVGSVLASLPLIPWFLHVTTVSTQPHLTQLRWARALEFKLLTRWLTEPLGVGLDHALGNDYFDFLRQPEWHGHPTYLVAVLHIVSIAAGVAIGLRAVSKLRSEGLSWRGALLSRGSSTELCCNAALWGYGLLLTLSCLPIHRHYMIIVYPLEALWFAYLALQPGGQMVGGQFGRRLLATMVVSQALLSASFLMYVHEKQTIDGDYGATYRSQKDTL